MKKITKISRILIALVLMFTIVFLPMTVIKTVKFAHAVFNSSKYQKRKIKVDSVEFIQSSGSMRSKGSGHYLRIHNHELNFSFILADHGEALLNGKRGKDALEPHFHEYMRNHHDSIWVWYHPSARVFYAKEEEVVFPVADKVKSLLINLLFAILGLFSVSRIIMAFVQGYRSKKGVKK